VNAAPVLSVRDLKVGVRSARGEVDAVRGLDLDVARGETLALVGESGCGKSLTALALAGLLPDGARIRSGRIVLGGVSIEGLPERRLRRLRGQRVGMVFQDPMAALNPVLTIGEQIVEAIRAHRSVSRAQARSEAESLLARVRLREGAQLLQAFPHQLSGGMRQRILIAIAIANRPDVLIADEPTTALDATVQAEILALLDELRRDSGMALVLITHDLGLVSRWADRVAVMYAGRAVETRSAATLADAAHPYTRALLAARPRRRPLRGPRPRLAEITGRVPLPGEVISGCAFADRCAAMTALCRRQAPETQRLGDAGVACHHPFAPRREVALP
jgi:peptide/nickel transport system ATP-binding protein